MTIGPMKAYRQAVQKYSGMKRLTDEAMQDWLDVVLPKLPACRKQMFIDEIFFLTTGLPPMDVDLISESNQKEVQSRGEKVGTSKRNLKAEENAFWIQRRAVEVFGAESKATEWLTRKNRTLKNTTPLSLLGTKAGNARVEGMLKRVKRSPLPSQTSLKAT